MMSRWVSIGIGLVLIAVAAIGIDRGFAQESDEGPYTYTKSSTQEGFFRPILPIGEYACRFFTNYEAGDESLPSGYMEASAYMLDEHEDEYSSFESSGEQDVKFVSVIERPSATADQDELWEFRNALANFWSFSSRVVISDTTPKVEISLSRAFRQRGLRWTFQCVDFEWPEG